MPTKNATILNTCSRCSHTETGKARISIASLQSSDDAIGALVARGVRDDVCPKCGSYSEARIRFA